MHYTGNIYRPPFEASSLLLQVTVGCSHNRCAFCTMYRDVPFRMEPLEQIEADLEEARQFAPDTRRVFLENGDAFVLSADRLKQIAAMIHEKLPGVETITMYASIHNIKTKTDEELRQLRALGINELNVGVESGLDAALDAMQKGYTAEEAIQQLLRLKAAGITFCANVIFGCAGRELRLENALKTAELINRTSPYLFFTGTIHADPGCPLYEQMQSGLFHENTAAEYLEEQETFLQHLTVENSYCFGLHPANIVRMQGWLPQDRQAMIEAVRKKREGLTAEQLASVPARLSGEGAILSL